MHYNSAMPCPRCNELREAADATRRRREPRTLFRPQFETGDSTPQQLEAEADLAIIRAELDLLEHKASCEECKRGYPLSD